MSDLKCISILVFVLSAFLLVESFDEPVSDQDANGQVERVFLKQQKQKQQRKSKVSEALKRSMEKIIN